MLRFGKRNMHTLRGPPGHAVQTLVGVLSDRILSRLGRRTPYFLIGAIKCEVGVMMLFVVIVGAGLAWGSIMGNPYVIVSNSIPLERNGGYMGIFNMMIVAAVSVLWVQEGWKSTGELNGEDLGVKTEAAA